MRDFNCIEVDRTSQVWQADFYGKISIILVTKSYNSDTGGQHQAVIIGGHDWLSTENVKYVSEWWFGEPGWCRIS